MCIITCVFLRSLAYIKVKIKCKMPIKLLAEFIDKPYIETKLWTII